MSNYFKILLGLALSLFVITQIQPFLDLGIITLFLFVIELIIFIALIILVIIGWYKTSNYPSKSHKIVLVSILVLMGLIIYKPRGFITDELIYGEDVLYANSEGVASCTQSLSFKKDGKFLNKSVCFGTNREVGNYTYRNDTIYFDSLEKTQYKFGVIHRNDSILEMFLKQPLTDNDFDSTQFKNEHIQKKIEQSKSHQFKIYKLNGF